MENQKNRELIEDVAKKLPELQSSLFRIQSLFSSLDEDPDVGYYKTLTRVGRALEILDNVSNEIKSLQLSLLNQEK